MKISCTKRKNKGSIPLGSAAARSSPDAPRRYRAVLIPGTGGKIDFRPVDGPGFPALKPGATPALGRKTTKDAAEPGDSRRGSPIEFSHPPAPGRESTTIPVGTRTTLGGHPGLVDEVDVVVEDIAIRLSRELKTTLPHEVTVVLPRVDVTKRFQDGKLVEVNVAYAGITVSHSPRLLPRKP